MSWETIQFANGKYVGETAYVNGEKVRHGFGKMHWNYSDTYEGYWHNDEMHTINGETGKYFFSNGNVYEGQIRYGEICGVGCLKTKKGASYNGEFKDGQPHGYGTFTFPDGKKINARWENCKIVEEISGSYQIKYIGPNKYEGEVSLRTGEPCGYGVLTYAPSTLSTTEVEYSGNWLDGKFHGQGIQTWSNGSYKNGEWEFGEFKYGTNYNAVSNKQYIGYRLNSNSFIGKQVDMTTNSVVYGHFLNGKLNSYPPYGNDVIQEVKMWGLTLPDRNDYTGNSNIVSGTTGIDEILYNGGWYSGGLSSGKYHSFGIFFNEKEKFMYVGYWLLGKQYGYGVEIDLATNKITAGWFENNHITPKPYNAGLIRDYLHILYPMMKTATYSGQCNPRTCNPHGFGTFDRGDSVYTGFFIDGRFNGYGMLKGKDGSLYRGDFKNGLEDGYGIYQNDEYIYEGSWEGGLPHGEGRKKYADGKILIGEFKYGECLSDPIYPNKSAGSNSGSNSSASSNKTSTIKNETSSTTQKTTAKKTTANAKVNAKPTEKVSSVKESSPAPEKKVSAPVKKDVKDLKIAYNCTYTGTTLNDKPNGKGKATYTGLSYVTYEGDFVDGKWHGKGKLTYKYDDYYEGDFVGGKFHGKGVRTFREDYSSNGFKRYEGDFVDGKMCGNGTLTYLSGDEYKGQFSNDKPHGKGVKTSPFGSIEDGTFENGDFVDGKIVVPEKEESKPATPPSPTISDADYLTYASSYFAPDYKPDTQPQKIDANSLKDGKYEGETLNGVPHGKGKLTFNDGGYYEGDFVNGLPHGKGKRVFKPKGIVTQYQSYEGNFANGKMNGKGTLYYTDGSYYVGAFSKDKPHGFGERYSTLGYKQRGKWEKGEFVSGDTLSTM